MTATWDMPAPPVRVPLATLVRPFIGLTGRHRKAGPAVTGRPARPGSHTRRATSAELLHAYEVVNDLAPAGGEIGCACETITEHSLTGEA
jgi:hypothetical protein